MAKQTISQINGPTATHLASGRGLGIVDDLAATGTVIMGTSSLEDLAQVKAACRRKLTVLGNLNGIEMCNWTPDQAEDAVKKAIAAAGPGGGISAFPPTHRFLVLRPGGASTYRICTV